MSFFVTFDTMLLVGSFFSLVYSPLVRCSLHLLMWSSLSSTTVVLPLSAGRMMMFSFWWRDFKDVDCFLVRFLSGGFALRMIELRSDRMVSASSVVIPVNVVSILVNRCIVGRVAGVIEKFISFSSSSLSSSLRLMTHFNLSIVVVVCSLISLFWLSFLS